nr:MAG TPA: hypothetical protein [Caudoviricetes sp.]
MVNVLSKEDNQKLSFYYIASEEFYNVFKADTKYPVSVTAKFILLRMMQEMGAIKEEDNPLFFFQDAEEMNKVLVIFDYLFQPLAYKRVGQFMVGQRLYDDLKKGEIR